MSNELDEMIGAAPTLTLNPTATETTDAIAAMTLTPDAKEEEKIPVPEVNLTPQEKKMVDDFAAQIDITNTQQSSFFFNDCSLPNMEVKSILL